MGALIAPIGALMQAVLQVNGLLTGVKGKSEQGGKAARLA
jgi:hypothetical protein